MSTSPEGAATFFKTWKSTSVGHLGLQSMSYRVGTPCMTMDDPMVKEMLGVFTERLPKYNQEYLTEFNQREVETLTHGDFHGGNNMFGVNKNEGNVVVYDFQVCGHGLACFDVINLLVAKGQLISKCLFGVIVSTKKPTNFF